MQEAWRLAMVLQLAAVRLPAEHPDRELVERLAGVLERLTTDQDAADEAPATVLAEQPAGRVLHR